VTYDAVVFDMDGVLLEGYHTPREVYREAAADGLVALGCEEPVPDAVADPEDVAAFRQACEELGVDATEVWKHRERGADEREIALIADGERALYDDVSVLADLDVPLGVVSNNRQETVAFVVEHFSLPVAAARGRDPTIAGWKRKKPDPHYLEVVLAELGVPPDRALFVGDRRSDVQTGHAAGADGALLTRDGDPPSGDPEPDHHVEAVGDLLELV